MRSETDRVSIKPEMRLRMRPTQTPDQKKNEITHRTSTVSELICQQLSAHSFQKYWI